MLRLLGFELPVPDHTTLSRRGRGGRQRTCAPRAGQHRLELFGQGEWNAERHSRARPRWLKLYLAVDAGTGEIAAHMLTDGNVEARSPA